MPKRAVECHLLSPLRPQKFTHVEKFELPFAIVPFVQLSTALPNISQLKTQEAVASDLLYTSSIKVRSRLEGDGADPSELYILSTADLESGNMGLTATRAAALQ